jgi:hypothetical protein
MENFEIEKYSPQELETIILLSIIEDLDKMLSRRIFDVLGSDNNAEIKFHTEIQQYYFEIILVDFISPFDKTIISNGKSSIEYLYDICNKSAFGVSNATNLIKPSIDKFSNWINESMTISDMNLEGISNDEITIKRIDFLKICGNKSKHHFARLGRMHTLIKNILEGNNNESTKNDYNFEILIKIYDRLNQDIFLYHSSLIVEMLNKIRWGIYCYLKEIYNVVFKQDSVDPMRYSYNIPNQIKNETVKSCFYELMNSVRGKPYIDLFETTRWLQMRY